MNQSREKAWTLFRKYVQADSLTKHCLAVEAAMRGCAKQFNEDVEIYGVCGLLHDIDFEQWPDNHLSKATEILSEAGYSEDFIQAVMGHGDFTGVQRETTMAKCLYAVDQLASFIVAVALMRPTYFEGMTPKSVKKKMKDKAFARAVDREEIKKGAEELGVDLSELIQWVIDALNEREKELQEMGMSLL